MKIFFWTSSFWPSIGGVETQGFLFVTRMQEKGHSCLVLTPKGDPDEKDEEIYKGISIRRFDFKSILFNLGGSFSSVRSYLDWVLKSFQPDIVHLNTCLGESAIMFSMLRNIFSIPVILTMHAPHFGGKMLSIVKKICNQADQICCVSQWVLREIGELIPEIKNKLNLIYNGLPLFKVAPTPLSFFPPIILLIGRLSPEKGFKSAIEAFSLFKKEEPSAKLLIAGDGIEYEALLKQVNELQLENEVEFIGRLNREEIPHTINRASLVVIPSYFESFGLAALEAMQMGRPVIASNVGGLPEIVSSPEVGSLVPPKNPDALYKAIRDVFLQPERAKQMGEKGRKIATEYFTIDQNVTRYEALYCKLK